jgi:hypothetical protein
VVSSGAVVAAARAAWKTEKSRRCGVRLGLGFARGVRGECAKVTCTGDLESAVRARWILPAAFGGLGGPDTTRGRGRGRGRTRPGRRGGGVGGGCKPMAGGGAVRDACRREVLRALARQGGGRATADAWRVTRGDGQSRACINSPVTREI